MTETVKVFLDDLIPKNLPEKKKEELYDELEAHISDLADSYFELGMTREESEDAALKEFGKDEATKKSIYSELENVYREKTRWAFIPAAVILLLNVGCGLMSVFVASGDYIGDPDAGKAAISFSMIFINLALIFSARCLHFRKSLIGIGAVNLLIGASVLMCYYPQCALWTIENNIYFVIDRLMSSALPGVLKFGSVFFYWGSIAFCLLLAVYCFVSAARLNKKSFRSKRRIRKKAAGFTAVYLLISGVSCAILPLSEAWFHMIPY